MGMTPGMTGVRYNQETGALEVWDVDSGAYVTVGATSQKLRSAIRNLTIGEQSLTMLVLGDSTGYLVGTWPYLLPSLLATKYPAHTVDAFTWNVANQQYDQPTRMATGTDGAAYVLTGSAASNTRLSIADSALTSPAGDIDVRVKLSLNGALPSATCTLAGKYGSAGSRSWYLDMTTTGALSLGHSADGTAILGSTSDAVVSELTAAIWVRATLDVNNGATGRDIKFYTSTDGSTWTQLGTTKTTAGVTSLFDTTTAVQFIGKGAASLAQQNHNFKFYECEVYASLDGTARIVDIDAGAIPPHSSATAGTFVDDRGNTVSVTYGSGVLTGAPRLAFFNGSVTGADPSDASDATRYPKLVVGNPGLTFISFSHNGGTDPTYRAEYKTLTDALMVTNPDMCITAILQNKRSAPAANINEHAVRTRAIAELAASQRFDVVDVYSEWDTDWNDPADGVHPTATGKTEWYRIVASYLGFAV